MARDTHTRGGYPEHSVFARMARWVDDRLGASTFAEHTLKKVFPDHWSFMLGEIALYAFVMLVVTGVFLTFFFDPSVSESAYEGSYQPLRGVPVSDAYRSTLALSLDVRAGLVMRQAHHWAAIVFIAAVVVHLMRVFFTGAFRRPREINWIIGVTLAALAFFNGFTGYSLPDDLLSGTGLRIAYSITLSMPLVGTWLASLLFGGEFPGPDIIERLFVIHILLIPAAIVVLLTIHLAIVVRHKHTQFSGPGRAEDNVVGERMWPTYAAKALGLFFLTLFLFLGEPLIRLWMGPSLAWAAGLLVILALGVFGYQPAWAEPPGGMPRLVLVNVALGTRLGTGRDFLEAWRNLQGETSPTPMATGAEALLAEVRRWWWYADSALQRGDLADLGRALEVLRELLERRR